MQLMIENKRYIGNEQNVRFNTQHNFSAVGTEG